MTNTVETTVKPSFLFNPAFTKANISMRLKTDAAFQQEAIVIIYGFQTANEKDAFQAIQQNKLGFMSSHASNGTRIAKKIIAKQALTAEDVELAAKIAPKYTRQIAFYFREMPNQG